MELGLHWLMRLLAQLIPNVELRGEPLAASPSRMEEAVTIVDNMIMADTVKPWGFYEAWKNVRQHLIPNNQVSGG